LNVYVSAFTCIDVFIYHFQIESNAEVIEERSPGIKLRKPEFTSQICIYLVSGFQQTHSFRILQLENKWRRDTLLIPQMRTL
jgi:hypothetical protein